MQNFILETNQLPTIAEADVVVCAGGPAGIGAAIMAARCGASVILLESQGCLGGVATAGMMSHWGGRSSSKVMQEIFDITYERAHEVGWSHNNDCGKDAIYHAVQKIVLAMMLSCIGFLSDVK